MKPQDRLPEVRLAEGAEPEVYLLTREDRRWAFSRRDVMGAAVAAAMAATKGAQAQSCGGARAHMKEVRHLAFTPDGTTLISGGYEDNVKFWRLPWGAHYRTLPVFLKGLAISPDGSRLVAGGGTGGADVYSLPEAQKLLTLRAPDGTFDAAGTADGRLLAFIGIFALSLFSMPDGALLKARKLSSTIDGFVISPDGELLVVSEETGRRVVIWTLPEFRGVAVLPAAVRKPLAISPDGGVLASSSGDKTVRLWSLPGGTALRTLSGHTDYVSALAFTPDGSMVISGSGSSDRSIRLWSMRDGSPVKMLTGHEDWISALAVSPDGRLLASGAHDGALRLWSLPDGEPVASCMMDLTATPSTGKGIQYKIGDVTYTLPCGAAIPAGAVCTCNCVPGTGCSCVGQGGGGGGGGGICTCIPVVYRYPN